MIPPFRRRWLALVLIAALLAAGCSSAPAEPIDASGVKAVWIYEGPVASSGWNQSHETARLEADEATGAITFAVANVPEDSAEFEELLRDLIVTDGVNLVFGTGFEQQSAMDRLARDFPEVVFEHAGGFKRNQVNFGNFYGRMYEPRFLSGMAAALVSETGTLGYIAGFPFPEVVRGINAFALGAQSVNPEATVEVVWTNSEGDPAVEVNAASVLLELGADVLAAQQDSTATGEFAASNGVRWVGYGMDLSEAAPASFLTATVWDWTGRYVQVINQVATGDYEPISYWGGLDHGVVVLAELKGVSDEIDKAVDDERQRIVKGDRQIFAGPLIDQTGSERLVEGEQLNDDELRTMDWFVEGVIGSPRR